MTDLDQSGRGFQRVRTYLGPTLGWKDELVSPSTEIKVGGIHAVQPGESLLLVNVAASVQINLPDVRTWFQQSADQPATAFERSITIKDIGGNAFNFNIVVAPFGQQSIDNIQQSLVISQAKANVKVIPLVDMSGWMVETAIGAGGGSGGGGDVFKAGNNTFTGTNIFNGPTQAVTVDAADNTTRVATTAFVNLQGYVTAASLLPYAPLLSPVFTGDPRAPIPTGADADDRIATVGFVETSVAAIPAGAPVNAEYALGASNPSLPSGRILTNTATITWDFSTPGQAKASTAAGGGNVSNVGTPTNLQLAQWTTATTIQGIAASSLGFAPIASPTFTGDPKAPTPLTADNDTSIATTAYVKSNLANYQPLDGDLTAISALLGTNTIYYRSAVDIWSPVTFSGLSFSGGVLTVTAGGGNVSNSGTPTLNQIARWTDATHIEGVSAATAGLQPLDATLTALAGLATAADRMIYFTGVDLASLATLTPFARTILDDLTAADVRATIGAAAVTSGGPGIIITTYTAVGGFTHTFDSRCTSWMAEIIAGGGGGGAGGNAGGAGTAGGNSSFASSVANGGTGAVGGSYPGPGGGLGSGTVAFNGNSGHAGTWAQTSFHSAAGGNGGAGPFGGGTRNYIESSGDNAGAGTGAGGAGGSLNTSVTSPGDFSGCGGGSGGYSRIYGTTITPTSGAVGSGGSGGGGPVFAGYSGGNGGSGRVIVTEYLKL